MSVFKQPKDKRDQFWWRLTWFAFVVTSLWFGGALLVGFFGPQKFTDLTLNEAGDFWAGIAAPPAFLWLILAFFQQGRELRLQIEEMRHSVEQFRKQTEIFERQLSATRGEQIKKEIDMTFDEVRDQLHVALKPAMHHTALYKDKMNIGWSDNPRYADLSNLPLIGLCDHLISRFNALARHGPFVDLTEGRSDWSEVTLELGRVVREVGELKTKIRNTSYRAGDTKLEQSRLDELIRILKYHFKTELNAIQER